MTDPMMAADGLTYQRAAIKAWIDKGYKGTCTCLIRLAVLPAGDSEHRVL
jgi:hypothetical protein